MSSRYRVNMRSWLSLPITILLISGVQCAKILAVFPMSTPSSYILGSSLVVPLAEKGHDVTMKIHFVEKKVPKNGTYKDIVLTGFKEEHERKFIPIYYNLFTIYLQVK